LLRYLISALLARQRSRTSSFESPYVAGPSSHGYCQSRSTMERGRSPENISGHPDGWA
jgi:hypothetical protein